MIIKVFQGDIKHIEFCCEPAGKAFFNDGRCNEPCSFFFNTYSNLTKEERIKRELYQVDIYIKGVGSPITHCPWCGSAIMKVYG